MAVTRDYYEVLGVARGATEAEIKTAFRALAMQLHPDRNPGDAESERRFKEIAEAYAVLSDPAKRSQYDTYGRVGGASSYEDIFGNAGFGDIFDMFFGGQAGGRGRRGPQRGSDLRYAIHIDFREAVFGVEREIEVPRRDVCPTCSGSGAEVGSSPVGCADCGGQGQVRRVAQSIFGQVVNVTACPRCGGEGQVIEKPCKDCTGSGRQPSSRKLNVSIPAGVDDGDQIRLGGEGEVGVRGGGYGDLYVAIQVQPDPVLRRSGSDIHYDLGVSFAQAALGDRIEVPSVDGPVELELPAGTQYGTRLRIGGHGVPHIRSGRRGDQIVVVHVITPTKLTTEQRTALEELGGITGQPAVAPKGFLDKLRDSLGF